MVQYSSRNVSIFYESVLVGTKEIYIIMILTRMNKPAVKMHVYMYIGHPEDLKQWWRNI